MNTSEHQQYTTAVHNSSSQQQSPQQPTTVSNRLTLVIVKGDQPSSFAGGHQPMPNAPFRVVVKAPPRPPQFRLGREEGRRNPRRCCGRKTGSKSFKRGERRERKEGISRGNNRNPSFQPETPVYNQTTKQSSFQPNNPVSNQ